MIVGFVMFKDGQGKPKDGLGVFAIFNNGLIRSATPMEFGELRASGGPYAAVPIRREPESELGRYQAYDNALRS